MKAVIYRQPGCLDIVEKPIPSIRPGEILLQVRSVGICGTDLMIFQGGMAERAIPGRILGHETVAVIADGAASQPHPPGTRVVVEPTIACNQCVACQRGFTHVCENLKLLGIDADGALQEFWCVPEDRLHRVPESVPDLQAALIEPLAVAVHDVRVAAVQPDETAVVIGAGPIGLLIALLVRRAKARVLVLERNAHRLAFARSLGFGTCDVSSHDPEHAVRNFTKGAGADVVFEVSGSDAGAHLMTKMAAVRGRLIVVGIQSRKASLDLFQIFFRELSLHGVRAYARKDFVEAIRLIASGEIDPGSFVSKRFPFGDTQAAFVGALSGGSTMKTLIDFTDAH